MIVRSTVVSGEDTGTPPVTQDIVATSGDASTLTPKAAMYWVTPQTSYNANPVIGSRIGLGITDGTTERSFGVMAEDGPAAGSVDAHTLHDTASVIHLPTAGGTGTLAGEADFDAFIAGGSRINWTDFLENFLCNGFHFFGDDVDAAVVDFTGNATADASTSVTGLSFAPNFVISLSHFIAYAADGVTADRKQSFGFAVKTPAGGIQQVCHTKFCNNRNAFLTSHAGALHDDSLAVAFDQTSDGPRLEVTAWTSDGLTITTRRASISMVTALLVMRFRNYNLWAGIPSLVTSSTGVKSITSPAFKVDGYWALASDLVTKNVTSRTPTSDGWSYGFSNGLDEDEVVFAGFEADNVPDGFSASDARPEIVRVISNPDTPTFSWTAEHQAFTENGFDINVTDASAADVLCAFVAFGAIPIVSSDTETITDQTAINVSTALSDTETIVDQAVLTGSAPAQSDTETISDQSVFSLTGNLPFSDTESLLDQHAFAIDIAHSETVEIQENVILLAVAADALLIVVSDTMAILDQAVLSGTGSIVVSDTVEISDLGNLAGDALIVVSDTETISENEQHYLGNVIVVSDTETITDDLSTPITATQTKGTQRGTSFQGGAEQGEALGGGAERGTVL